MIGLRPNRLAVSIPVAESSGEITGVASITNSPIAVSVGMGLLGLGSLTFLVIAGRSLSLVDFGDLATLWAIVFGLVGGLASPFEQEAIRSVAGAGRGKDLLRLAAALIGTVVSVFLLVGIWLATADSSISTRLNSSGLGTGLLIALVGLPLAAAVRGSLIGAERFRAAGGQLALEGALRAGGATALLLAGGRALWFGVVLGVAPLLSGVVVAPLVWGIRHSTKVSRHWRVLLSELATLALGTSIALVVMNLGPLLVRWLADAPAAGEFAAAFTLVRLPVFFAGPVAASLLPGFVRASTDGTLGHRLVHEGRRVGAAVIFGAVLLGLLTPTLVRSLYGQRFSTAYSVSLLLAASAVLNLFAMVLQSALLAAEQRRHIVYAWSAGALALLGGVALPIGPAALRVSLAYTFSAAVTVVIMYKRTTRGAHSPLRLN